MNPSQPAAPARVFIVDDHSMITTVLVEVINSCSDFVSVGVANDAETALGFLRANPVDILLVDLRLPGMSGIELIHLLQREDINPYVVVCSGVGTDQAIEAAFSAGAQCFVEKTAPVEELIGNLRAVMRGEFPLSDRAARVLRETVRKRSSVKAIAPQDLGIMRRLASGMKPKDVAQELDLSCSGVYKAHRRLMIRTGSASPDDLREVAARMGLVDQSFGSENRTAEPVAPTEPPESKPGNSIA